MTREKLEQIVADYFTDDFNVAYYGQCRSSPMDNPKWEAANRFFDARMDLGIVGYMARDAAIEVMRRRERSSAQLPLTPKADKAIG